MIASYLEWLNGPWILLLTLAFAYCWWAHDWVDDLIHKRVKAKLVVIITAVFVYVFFCLFIWISLVGSIIIGGLHVYAAIFK